MNTQFSRKVIPMRKAGTKGSYVIQITWSQYAQYITTIQWKPKDSIKDIRCKSNWISTCNMARRNNLDDFTRSIMIDKLENGAWCDECSPRVWNQQKGHFTSLEHLWNNNYGCKKVWLWSAKLKQHRWMTDISFCGRKEIDTNLRCSVPVCGNETISVTVFCWQMPS